MPSHDNALALAARAAQALTLLLAALIVASRLSLQEQGLFFVFLSLGTLVQLGEFGLGYALLQTASHLASQDRGNRLPALARSATRIGAALMLASLLIVGAAGVLVLQHRADAPGAHGSAVAASWLAYACAVALAHGVSLMLLFVEGARSVRGAWRVRLLQELGGGAVFIAALVAGAGLWSLAIYAGSRALLGAAGLYRDRPAPEPTAAAAAVDWRRQGWPFQWRVGLSGLAGFLVFQAVNPLLLLFQGSEAAGRFGLSLAIMNMLLLVTGAWPLSLAAQFGRWLAIGDASSLREGFRRTFLGSTLLAFGLAALAVLGLAVLQALDSPLARRLADLPTTAALMLAAGLNHVTAAVAVLLRAERREPLLVMSLVGGGLTVAAVALAAGQGTLLAPALACAGMAAIGVLWVGWHYRQFARRVFAAGATAGEPGR